MLKPTFIAHRGYASEYPENTLIALDAACKAGASYVEVDIQLSADKIPILFHDRDLLRLCQQKGAIHDYTLKELESFSVSYADKFLEKYANNKITTLQTFIEYLKIHPQLNAFIELKHLMIEQFGEEQVLEIILPMFSDIKEQVCFISYNQSILKNIYDRSDYETGIVVDDWAKYNNSLGWNSDWLFCSAEGLPEDNTKLNIKPKVAVFEVGNIGLAKHLLAKNISYLETFRIKEMLHAFHDNKIEEI